MPREAPCFVRLACRWTISARRSPTSSPNAASPSSPRDEVKLGTVVEVLDAPEADLFDGIIFDTTPNDPGGHKFVDAPEVEGDLRARRHPHDRRRDGRAAREAGEEPGLDQISPDDVAGEPGPSFWSKAWNRLSAKAERCEGEPDGPPLSRTAGGRPEDPSLTNSGRFVRGSAALRAVTGREVHAARITAQGLATRPAREPVEVAERLLAIQGQDPRGARLAVRARSEGLAASDVDRALDERRLIITWVNRGTLHLIRGEDYPLLQALTTPPLWTSCRTRLRQTGVGEARPSGGCETVAKALADDGPLTRAAAARARSTPPTSRPRARRFIHVLFYAAAPRGLRARADGRQGARLRRRARLARRAAGGRPRGGARRARPPLPRRPRPGDRRRPRPLGRPPARDARAGLDGDRPPDSSTSATASSTSASARSPRRSRRRACSAPSTRCCSAGPRARTSSAPHRPGHDQRHLPPLRPGQRPRRRHLAAAEGQGRDRAPRAGHEKGGRPARGRRGRRRSVPRRTDADSGVGQFRRHRVVAVRRHVLARSRLSSCSQTWFSETCR